MPLIPFPSFRLFSHLLLLYIYARVELLDGVL